MTCSSPFKTTPKKLQENLYWVGATDWDRRLFDAFMPIPEGTTYNAYLIKGKNKVALIDTVEPCFADTLLQRLDGLNLNKIDYLVSNHAEQDHSGTLPLLLTKYPQAKIVCTPRAKDMLQDLLSLSNATFIETKDQDTLTLGNVTLRFIHFPWVHWPETMLTYVPEMQTLFPCDLFGSHLATNLPLLSNSDAWIKPAQLYFAHIMLPFRKQINKNLAKIKSLDLKLIAPSHGPALSNVEKVMHTYENWTSDTVLNKVILPFVSMHQSTQSLVLALVDALSDQNIETVPYNLEHTDFGKLTSDFVDAATIVMAAPTVLNNAHPAMLQVAHMANQLKPKARFYSILSSFGWSNKAESALQNILSGLKVEWLDSVVVKGQPNSTSFNAIRQLAEQIADRHQALEYNNRADIA